MPSFRAGLLPALLLAVLLVGGEVPHGTGAAPGVVPEADQRWLRRLGELTAECRARQGLSAHELARPGGPAAASWSETGCVGIALHELGVD